MRRVKLTTAGDTLPEILTARTAGDFIAVDAVTLKDVESMKFRGFVKDRLTGSYIKRFKDEDELIKIIESIADVVYFNALSDDWLADYVPGVRFYKRDNEDRNYAFIEE